jgi:4'-phosphopantetheinyl transferase
MARILDQLPKLPLANGIIVWQIGTSSRREGEFHAALADDERQQCQRLRCPQLQQQFVAARGALRTLLGRCLNQAPHGLRFRYGTCGKPALAGNDFLNFNVSHSAGMAVVAVAAGREVGVDIEWMNPAFEFQEVSAVFFSAKEDVAIHAIPAPLRQGAFYRGWTRKEALLKAKGDGLSGLAQQFQDPILVQPATAPLQLADRQQAGWTVVDLPVAGGYAAALAWKTAPQAPVVMVLESEGLSSVSVKYSALQ